MITLFSTYLKIGDFCIQVSWIIYVFHMIITIKGINLL